MNRIRILRQTTRYLSTNKPATPENHGRTEIKFRDVDGTYPLLIFSELIEQLKPEHTDQILSISSPQIIDAYNNIGRHAKNKGYSTEPGGLMNIGYDPG
jgi:hypothetical protein